MQIRGHTTMMSHRLMLMRETAIVARARSPELIQMIGTAGCVEEATKVGIIAGA